MIMMRSKPKEVLEHIYGIMSTTLPDDVISGELADLVGFDDIEIVAELLASRSSFVNAVSSDSSVSHLMTHIA
jgi:antiviral helicase SLH1